MLVEALAENAASKNKKSVQMQVGGFRKRTSKNCAGCVDVVTRCYTLRVESQQVKGVALFWGTHVHRPVRDWQPDLISFPISRSMALQRPTYFGFPSFA